MRKDYDFSEAKRNSYVKTFEERPWVGKSHHRKIMSDFPEADWKYMRALKSTLLERLCQRINQETARILSDSEKTSYEKYLEIFDKMRKDDMDIVKAFDDWRRSTISSRITEIYAQGLFTDIEIQGFTQQTKGIIDVCKPIEKQGVGKS